MTMNATLNTSMQTRRIVDIKTSHPRGGSLQGIVLGNSKDLVVLHKIESFEPDGILVIPKGWLDSVRSGPSEECADKILRRMVPLADLPAPPPYARLPHLDQIIDYLHEHDIWPLVESFCKGRVLMYRGPITKALVHSFKVHCYDSAGSWEKEYEIDYEEVYAVEIDSRRVRNFNAYMRQFAR